MEITRDDISWLREQAMYEFNDMLVITCNVALQFGPECAGWQMCEAAIEYRRK